MEIELLGELSLGAAVTQLLLDGIGDLVEDVVIFHDRDRFQAKSVERVFY